MIDKQNNSFVELTRHQAPPPPHLCAGVSTSAASSRSAATLASSGGSEALTDTLLPRHMEGGGGGGSREFGDARDEVSLAPSMSSLGSYDEHSGCAPPPFLQRAQEAGTADRPRPAVLLLPPAVDHTAGKHEPALRWRSRRSIPAALPSATTTSAGTEGGSACSFPPTGSGSAATVEGGVPTERERSSSRLGISFGGASKRRRSRRSSSSGIGARLAVTPSTAAVGRDGQEKSVASATGSPLTGATGAPVSSTTTAVATTALLKQKISWWRSRSKPTPKAPNRLSALTTRTGEDGLSRSAISSPAPPYSRGESDCGDHRPPRDGSTVSETSPIYTTASREPHHQLPAAREGMTNDERTRTSLVTSLLTSSGGSVVGSMSAGPLTETDLSMASFASMSAASSSAARVGGHSVAGPVTTASMVATKSPAGLAGAGAGFASAGVSDGGASGMAWGRLDSAEHRKLRKKRRGQGRTGTVQRVHKINLGSKGHQKVRGGGPFLAVGIQHNIA